MNSLFPDDSTERKTFPVYSGLLAYFPSALAKVARHSYVGNEKHNPGQSLHHDRAKSGDEADALVRHLMEGDYVGMAWRALALLQKHEEANGAPIAPAARNTSVPGMDAHVIAYIDGFPLTGGGHASHYVDGLTPAASALIELGDEDAPTAHLKNGEAIA